MEVSTIECQSGVRQKKRATADFIQPKYKNSSHTFGTLSYVNATGNANIPGFLNFSSFYDTLEPETYIYGLIQCVDMCF